MQCYRKIVIHEKITLKIVTLKRLVELLTTVRHFDEHSEVKISNVDKVTRELLQYCRDKTRASCDACENNEDNLLIFLKFYQNDTVGRNSGLPYENNKISNVSNS